MRTEINEVKCKEFLIRLQEHEREMLVNVLDYYIENATYWAREKDFVKNLNSQLKEEKY